MAPKGKQAVFKKKVYVYVEFFPLTGNTQTSGLQQDIVRISALGDLKPRLRLGGPPPKLRPKAGIYRRDFAQNPPVKRSTEGAFCETPWAECHRKLFSPSGKTGSTAGIFLPRPAGLAPPLVQRRPSAGPHPAPKASVSAHCWHVVLSGGPCTHRGPKIHVNKNTVNCGFCCLRTSPLTAQAATAEALVPLQCKDQGN